MAASIRSRRIAEQQARAKRTDILWIHRRNALHCLTGIQRLGEKTQLWIQRLIYSMREQYDDLAIQKELDELQARLDHQKELLRRRLARRAEDEQRKRSGKNPESIRLAPAPGAPDVWDM